MGNKYGDAQIEEAIESEREKLAIERRARQRAERQVAKRDEEVAHLTALVTQLSDANEYSTKPAAWVTRKPKAKEGHIGTPCLMVSDCHFDEVVDPDEVEGTNAYNRDIAAKRLSSVFRSTVTVLKRHLAGLDYQGITLLLGGDLFSGFIHEELERTNEGTVLEGVEWWLDPMVTFIGGLADEFDRVQSWCVAGNHGRLTTRPPAKQYAHRNLDWLFYRLLAREFRSDDRVNFTIPDSRDVTLKVHETEFLLTHGDQFRGGSGIAGMLSPLSLGQHRKAQRQMALDKSFDWLTMGHWHQYFMGRGLAVNGSLKGYDEFAYSSNFAFEPPAQALWVVTPEHGVSFTAPIFPADRKAEGW